MKFLPNNITTIIFDLGGVILNLNPKKTIDAFAGITGLTADKLVAYGNNEMFRNYEKGAITSSEFRNGLKSLFNISVADELLDEAWNAMLLDLPLERLEMIGRLRPRLKTYVLSNTNEIHIAEFNKIVREATNEKKIQAYFDVVYYSHKVGMRKPDAEIFEMVLNQNNLKASATLFIDDTLEHIQSAQKLGLHTWHLTNQDELRLLDNG
ncbi:MAG: HAD family phosphatase [Cyclobacteriaceae bacterium]|nr:HAD family phosphatase [Cyclobacteriaceae bacterium]